MSGKSDKFFLGKNYNLQKSEMGENQVFYDPDDLTTHAVITGMTGSGKTGLAVLMLEEAVLQGIPAIVVDPKGDLTNLLLHFPDLLPSDFQPWVDQDAARRDGVTVEAAAEKAASLWKNGLESYGLGKPDIEALRDTVDFAIYTPGSDAGLPVSIMASLSAPPIPWEGNKEILREKISSTVTAILGLVGLKDIDPVRAREHILLANIFEAAWKVGKDLDMATLITHVQSPTFDKLGVFPLEQFYPEKDRFELAMLLNNFLAAPAFQTWLEGQPLDIEAFLFNADGKPRHSVFYLAHLSDEERMFFITLLYTSIESWMRTQKGSSGLRALVYFDEIAGYLPPVANPPSKGIILRMLKQARAFGVGLMVATQNPVDLDYKALSNAGTWIIGKLQTDQDKNRLLDGLEGAAPGMDRKAFDKMISLIDKRVFLLHNVHEDAPEVFHTRWAMNYLPGPLTRSQLPALNALVGAGKASAKTQPSEKKTKTKSQKRTSLGQDVPPAVPGSIPEYYFPIGRGPVEALKAAGRSTEGEVPNPKTLYRAALMGQARVAYVDRKYNLSEEIVYTARIDELKRKGLVRWENFIAAPVDPDDFSGTATPGALYDTLDNLTLDDSSFVKGLEADFTDWIYRTQTLTIRQNEALDVFAGPGVSEAEFNKMCADAVEDKKQEAIDAIKDKYEAKLDKLELKLKKETLELEEDKQELGHRRLEEVGKGVENALKLFSGRSSSISTSLTKRRMTSKAKADLEASEMDVKNVEAEIAAMQEDMTEELQDLEANWADVADKVIEVPVSPYKKNIFVEVFGVVWLPFYAFEEGDSWETVPAFEWEEAE
ncbi:ATP-binding protein [Chloroflexota bacterium]|nr:ATP-binding protein [Chloroflexota bacterium]